MLKRIGLCVLVASVASLAGAAPAYAQRTSPAFTFGDDGPRQTINFTIGSLRLHQGEDRDPDDVILINEDIFAFLPEDLTGPTWTAGIEYLVPIGNFLEAGAGIAFSPRRTAPSVYREFVDSDGSEIEQDFSFRVVPMSFTVRALPAGQGFPVQPYVGAGLGLFRYSYLEEGEFVDEDNLIFEAEFEETGWEPGLVVLGGVRWATEAFAVGGELRYHKAAADLPEDFFGSKLDLGGWIVQATIGARF